MLTAGFRAFEPGKENLVKFQFQLFAFMWAAATLFHQVQFKTLDNKFHYFLLTLAAITVLLKPQSIFRFAALVCLQLNESFISMPEISNHWALVTLVNLTIIQTLVYTAWKSAGTGFKVEQFFDYLVKLIRIEVLLFYFFVVFHKLNSAFLNPEVSCATDFIVAQNYSGILPSRFFLVFNIWIVLLIEAIIPLLLLFRSTRTAGLLTGIIFHIILAYNPLNGFYDFSSTILALYVFFLPPGFLAFLYNRYRQFSPTAFMHQFVRTRFRFNNSGKKTGLIAIIIILLVLIVAIDLGSYLIRDFYRYIIWTIYSLGTVIILVQWILQKRKKKEFYWFSYSPVPHWTFVTIPLLLILNGIAPYLGSKTEYSFAMFSNLRTEGGISNHYLVPASVQIFNYQKDLVEVISSSDPVLQDLGEKGKLITYFELKETFRKRKIDSLRYIRSGNLHDYDALRDGKNHDLTKPNSYLKRKFLDFRVISKNEAQPCSH